MSPAWAFAPLALVILAAIIILGRLWPDGSCRGGWTWELSPEATEEWQD